MNWLQQFIDYKGISVFAFEKKIGKRSTIQKAIRDGSNLGSNILSKIIDEFPEINPLWLLTGKGEMLRSEDQKKEVPAARDEKYIASLEKNIHLLEDKLAIYEAEKKPSENNKLDL